MQQYVTDTQCLLWHMGDRRRLSKTAQRIFASAEEGRAQILVPSIVLVEAIFLVQRQRVKEDVLNKLLSITEQPDANFYVTPLNMAVVQALRSFGPAAVPERQTALLLQRRLRSHYHYSQQTWLLLRQDLSTPLVNVSKCQIKQLRVASGQRRRLSVGSAVCGGGQPYILLQICRLLLARRGAKAHAIGCSRPYSGV